MSEQRDDILELAAGYVLDVLDEAETRRVEDRLARGDQPLAQAIAEYRESAALMAHVAPAAEPSPALRGRVLAAVKATRPEAAAPAPMKNLRPKRAFETAWNWGWAAAAAALAIVSALNYMAVGRLRSELDATREQLALAQKELTSVRLRVIEEQSWASVLASPDTRRVRLGVTPDGNQAMVAYAAYDPVTQRAMLVFENFAAPTGKDYELWAIRDGKPASLGLVRAGADGRAILRLEGVGAPDALAAFAVSLEPAGGSPTPTAPSGPVVMLGKIGT